MVDITGSEFNDQLGLAVRVVMAEEALFAAPLPPSLASLIGKPWLNRPLRPTQLWTSRPLVLVIRVPSTRNSRGLSPEFAELNTTPP